jgi:hypothetical protein
LNPIYYYNPIIAPLIKILHPPLARMEGMLPSLLLWEESPRPPLFPLGFQNISWRWGCSHQHPLYHALFFTI